MKSKTYSLDKEEMDALMDIIISIMDASHNLPDLIQKLESEKDNEKVIKDIEFELYCFYKTVSEKFEKTPFVWQSKQQYESIIGKGQLNDKLNEIALKIEARLYS